LIMVNSTVADNTATNVGGGIRAIGEDVELTNVTMAGNQANARPGIYGAKYFSRRTTLTFANTIIQDGVTVVDAPTQDLGGNLIGGDALLGPFQDNGGPTPTMAILPGSPAIDGGVNSLAVDASSNPLTSDQRGFPRISGANVDLGA